LSDAFLGELSLDAADVVRLSRAYDFEATHRMYNAELSEAENHELFGKGTNPFGHGHSFHVRISARLGDRQRRRQREASTMLRGRHQPVAPPAPWSSRCHSSRTASRRRRTSRRGSGRSWASARDGLMD
jgi:hypothetical protein